MSTKCNLLIVDGPGRECGSRKDARIALMGVQERVRGQDWCLALEDLKHEVDVTVQTGTGLGHKLASLGCRAA